MLVVSLQHDGAADRDLTDSADVSDTSDTSDATESSDPSDTSDASDASDPSTSTDPSEPEIGYTFSLSAALLEQGASQLQKVEVVATILDDGGNPLTGLDVDLSIVPDTHLVPLSLSSTDENGAARAVYLASALGDVTISAATRIADTDYTIGQATLTIDSGACISSRDYFETRLWGPVIQQCSSCHNSMGRALEINPYVMTFPFEGEVDFSHHRIRSTRL